MISGFFWVFFFPKRLAMSDFLLTAQGTGSRKSGSENKIQMSYRRTD